jgi:hypothetical protein
MKASAAGPKPAADAHAESRAIAKQNLANFLFIRNTEALLACLPAAASWECAFRGW